MAPTYSPAPFFFWRLLACLFVCYLLPSAILGSNLKSEELCLDKELKEELFNKVADGKEKGADDEKKVADGKEKGADDEKKGADGKEKGADDEKKGADGGYTTLKVPFYRVAFYKIKDNKERRFLWVAGNMTGQSVLEFLQEKGVIEYWRAWTIAVRTAYSDEEIHIGPIMSHELEYIIVDLVKELGKKGYPVAFGWLGKLNVGEEVMLARPGKEGKAVVGYYRIVLPAKLTPVGKKETVLDDLTSILGGGVHQPALRELSEKKISRLMFYKARFFELANSANLSSREERKKLWGGKGDIKRKAEKTFWFSENLKIKDGLGFLETEGLLSNSRSSKWYLAVGDYSDEDENKALTETELGKTFKEVGHSYPLSIALSEAESKGEELKVIMRLADEKKAQITAKSGEVGYYLINSDSVGRKIIWDPPPINWWEDPTVGRVGKALAASAVVFLAWRLYHRRAKVKPVGKKKRKQVPEPEWVVAF